MGARDRLSAMCEGIIEKVIAKREVDDIGEGDEWSELRLETCEDDWTYDLAVEVRKLREGSGKAWWLIAYELCLPGGDHRGAKEGRAGAAFARRLWKAAWGQTYQTTNAVRETKEERVDRSLLDNAPAYFENDALELDIIKALTGKRVEWVTRLPTQGGLVVSHQETYVHKEPRLVKIKQGPKGRYVEFFEMPDPALLKIDPRMALAKGGPLRSVYLDRIIRVGA